MWCPSFPPTKQRQREEGETLTSRNLVNCLPSPLRSGINATPLIAIYIFGLNSDVRSTRANALVNQRLDYGNSTLVGIPTYSTWYAGCSQH